MKTKAFTLIELLIVVAIIAILAAIAVPNFLEAQTRSKVTRAKADMRTLVTGLEAYRVDNTDYPLDQGYGAYYEDWKQLTTPVPYINNIPLDPFPIVDVPQELQRWVRPGQPIPFDFGRPSSSWPPDLAQPYYRNNVHYFFVSPGPSLVYDTWFSRGDGHELVPLLPAAPGRVLLYDPTNGTVSSGDLIATSKGGLHNQ